MSNPNPASTGDTSDPLVSPMVRSLVLVIAAIGFLFDTYELLMFPVTGAQAISELLKVPLTDPSVKLWAGRMLWIAALCGGVFGLLGSWFIDRFGRKRIMVASILLYSFSPVAAAVSTNLTMLVIFRCTTFIGVCVEAVAAVTWLAELFKNKRTREMAIGWTLAFASVGGILVTEVFNVITATLNKNPNAFFELPVPEGMNGRSAWRYTLLTGLVPGALILLLMPFVPESRYWRAKKESGQLKRPSIGELFTPNLIRTTLVTTILSACAYASAFGALQLGPLIMVNGLPEVNEFRTQNKEAIAAKKKEIESLPAGSEEAKAAQAELAKLNKAVVGFTNEKKGEMQRWQEIGGLTGRIVLAVLLTFIPSRVLLWIFLVPGVLLYPFTYNTLIVGEFTQFLIAIFFCGLLTVGLFSYMSEFLPKVFPTHLRGTGGGFATNIGGRMIGTMAAVLNTEILSKQFTPPGPMAVAQAAALIAGVAFAIALVASLFLPKPQEVLEN